MFWLTSLLWAAEHRFSLQSQSVGTELHYTVWLPQEYDESRAYPLLVMLHGLGDSDQNWTRGRVLKTYRSAVEQGLLPEQIVLVPDGERGYWSNHIDSKQRYGDWVFEAMLDGHNYARW